MHPADTYLWLRCGACGLLRIEPGSAGDDGLTANVEPNVYADDDLGEWSGRAHRLAQLMLLGPEMRLLETWLPRGEPGRVLEIGCGSGILAGAVLKRRPDLTYQGIEPRLSAARVAAAQGVEIVGATLAESAVEPESVDAVVMIHVLEHIEDPVELLHAVHGLLKPGGRLILAVPTADSWDARRFGPRWYSLYTPRHRWVPTRRSLTRVVTAAGFEVEYLGWRAYRTPLVGFAASLLPGLQPVRMRSLARRSPLRALFGQVVFGVAMAACAPMSFAANAAGRGVQLSLVARKETIPIERSPRP